jgi:hypothetical protein
MVAAKTRRPPTLRAVLTLNSRFGSWRQSHGQLHICSWEEDANMAGKARKNSVSRAVSPNWRIRSHWVKFRHGMRL